MAVLIISSVILQTVINIIMLSIGGQRMEIVKTWSKVCTANMHIQYAYILPYTSYS